MTLIFPIVTLILLLKFYLHYIKISQPFPGTTEWIKSEVSASELTIINKRFPLEKRDIAPLIAITAFFSFLALFLLGDLSAPQSFFRFSDENEAVLIVLYEPEEISSIMFYPGLLTGHYILEFSKDGEIWLEQGAAEDQTMQGRRTVAMRHSFLDVFKWRTAQLDSANPSVRHIRITPSRTPMELGEVALFGADGRLISSFSSNAPELFDEQGLIPERPTYMNSMYFDEIYHGRTAFEFIRGVTPFETTHPPLGKVLIACGISIFGMTPFGWRFMGAVFGVLMLIVLYIFIKNMFGKTVVATCGTLLLGFDFMRFVQTRIATIDTYGVFFILLAYFFMYRYVTTPPDASFRKKLLPLALSGIAFGLGCASKWITVYAGFGLALIYFIYTLETAYYYKRNALSAWAGYLTKTLLCSALFFILVPAAIYILSYIPFAAAKGFDFSGGASGNPALLREFLEIVWNNQVFMFTYHSGLTATHPFSSVWWQWILNLSPILYFNSHLGGLRSSFGAFGNPAVWWGGFAAMVVMAVRVVKKQDGVALFILIGYLSQLLPWIPISRILFIYHYFPSTLFIVLALAHIFNTIFEKKRDGFRFAVYGYTAGTGALFAMFYPALTGVPAPLWYFSNFLRWIPGRWPF